MNKWVLIKKFAEATGYTDEAIRQKIKKGKWAYKKHFRKGPDGHILINVEEVNKWLESTAV